MTDLGHVNYSKYLSKSLFSEQNPTQLTWDILIQQGIHKGDAVDHVGHPADCSPQFLTALHLTLKQFVVLIIMLKIVGPDHNIQSTK